MHSVDLEQQEDAWVIQSGKIIYKLGAKDLMKAMNNFNLLKVQLAILIILPPSEFCHDAHIQLQAMFLNAGNGNNHHPRHPLEHNQYSTSHWKSWFPEAI